MNAWIAPPPPAAHVTRWTRNTEFLVYLVPVGAISPDRYASYSQLLQQNRVLPISSLTRPGGYAPELSPFKSFSWNSSGKMRFRFVSTTDRIESCDGEDVHAWNRPIGVIGICHCPSTPSLKDAYASFVQSIKHFPGTLVQKCFAFEHEFEVGTVEEVASLSNLVMFPVHHELDEGCSTVSLHLQVVLDTIAVTILMSLESTIRAAMRQQAQSHHSLPSFPSSFEFGEMASFLLDTNVEPSQSHQQQNQQQHTSSMPLLSPPQSQSLHATISSMASTAVSSTASALTAPFTDSRSRKRQLARQKKLFGDYSVLLYCIPDAMEHYASALELLKDEERKSNGASGDVLWLAAALEGYAYCLFLESKDQFVVELVEKASEAVALYSKAGVSDLECQLIEKIGWYYVAVALQIARAKTKGKDKVNEGIWIKRLLWDALERGLALFPDLTMQRRVEFMIDASRMLECVGHRRRMALFLHEAVALLIARNYKRSPSANTPSSTSGSNQRQKDLQAALLLERITAARLGIVDNAAASTAASTSDWEVTTLYRNRKARRRGAPADASGGTFHEETWLVVRFHVLRQLITIAKMLGDSFLVGKYCIQLLRILPWCDSIAAPALTSTSKRTASSSTRKTGGRTGTSLLPAVDQVQRPFTSHRGLSASVDRIAGLYPKSSVYFTPPSSVDTKTRRYNFSLAGSPSATMSSAAASLSSTIASTPRILSTPRQQFSAAMSAISTKASPSFASFSHHSPHSMNSTHSSSSPTMSGMLANSPGDASSEGRASFDGNGVGRSPSSAAGNNSNGYGASRLNAQERQTEVLPVWNLRSKDEVVKVEKSVLYIMESECSSLRPSEQVKLSTFLSIEKLRVLPKVDNPFLTKAKALELYAPSAQGDKPSQSADRSDFFYSPFEKQQQQRGAGNAYGDDSGADSMYEKVFAVSEKIEVEMILSNPFGVAIDIQQVTAWVVVRTEDEDEDAARDHNQKPFSSSSAAIECYPASIVLAPYEKQKSVILGIQPLKEGVFQVCGCFLKVLGLTTSFGLDTSLEMRVVGRLPLASMTLCEFGSLTASGLDAPRAKTTQEKPNENMRISMFSSETKQCELRVRNVGPSAISSCRLSVTIWKRGVAKKTLVLLNTLGLHSSTSENNGNDSELVLQAESITIRCQALYDDGREPTTVLPMQNGDIASIRFEILLQKAANHRYPANGANEALEEEEQVVWSLVYADDPVDVSPDNSPESVTDAVFYRETKLALSLVSLPSLRLSSVALLPSSSECVRPPQHSVALLEDDGDDQESTFSRAVLDNAHALVVVEVTNPTETAFRFRMRRQEIRGADESDADNKFTCDVEIGRKCSRRLALEVPRVLTPSFQAPHGDTHKLAVLLNSLIELEWETYFGTTGKLQFEDHLWTKEEEATALPELLAPELTFEISAPLLRKETEQENTTMEEKRVVEKKTASGSPFSFFQGPHVIGARREVQVRAFEYLPIRFQIRNSSFNISDNDTTTAEFRVSCEVCITQQDDSEDDVDEIRDHVVVVGMLQTVFDWHNNGKASDEGHREHGTKNHDIQVLFLSHGVFRVAMCARVENVRTGEIRDIWCHQPLYIKATE
uniref:Trs120/TRAPPC9 N-terminal domain-containing protein n=1 Tax=Globisporangium ultimum (strain ATCC 200006 / CBS 805.95 / DAOM BR144) TaxID=431595 RepID=K3X7H9_GLOUD